MPTDTYYNLPKEKQQRIFEAARAEMARVPINELSINQIVQHAGISRGSFYQYFTDKHDLEAYILRDFIEQFRQGIRACTQQTDGNLFDAMKMLLHGMIEMAKDQLLRQTMQNLIVEVSGREGSFHHAMALQQELIDILAEGGRIETLKLETQEEVRQLARILFLLFKETTGACLCQTVPTEKALQEFDAALTLLRNTMERRQADVQI